MQIMPYMAYYGILCQWHNMPMARHQWHKIELSTIFGSGTTEVVDIDAYEHLQHKWLAKG
jgi:hypothetical protein